jgi:soluble lytic murein transglycosylase-like protein
VTAEVHKAAAAVVHEAKKVGARIAGTPGYLKSLIEDAAHRWHVDPHLVATVMHMESGGNPHARSGVGAMGLMQLMPATARQFGVTNPYDPAQSIEGGAHMLSGLMTRYHGNTRNALAAYNAGPGNVDKYGGVPPFAETQNYVRHGLAQMSLPYQQGGQVADSQPSKLRSRLVQAIGGFEGYYLGTPAHANNNPGNLAWAPTQSGSKDGFAQFDSPEAGWRALDHHVGQAMSKGLSLNQFFAGKRGVYDGFAPASNFNSPYHYAATVANWLGVSANVPFDQLEQQQPRAMQEGGAAEDDEDADSGGGSNGGDGGGAGDASTAGAQEGDPFEEIMSASEPEKSDPYPEFQMPEEEEASDQVPSTGEADREAPTHPFIVPPAAAAPPAELEAAPDVTSAIDQQPTRNQVLAGLMTPPDTSTPVTISATGATGKEGTAELPAGASSEMASAARDIAKITSEDVDPDTRLKMAEKNINDALHWDTAKQEQGIQSIMDMAQKSMHPSISSVLLRLGLGMLASRSPFFGEALGEAGLGAMSAFDKEKQAGQAMFVQATTMAANLEDKRRQYELNKERLAEATSIAQQNYYQKRLDAAQKRYDTAYKDFQKDPLVQQDARIGQYNAANPQNPITSIYDPNFLKLDPVTQAEILGQKLPSASTRLPSAAMQTYRDDVKAYGDSIGKTDPSTWDKDERQAFLQWRASATAKPITVRQLNQFQQFREDYATSIGKTVDTLDPKEKLAADQYAANKGKQEGALPTQYQGLTGQALLDKIGETDPLLAQEVKAYSDGSLTFPTAKETPPGLQTLALQYNMAGNRFRPPLTASGQKLLSDLAPTRDQIAGVITKLEPYRNNDNPGTFLVPYKKYKTGVKSPEGELGNSISDISLAKIQASVPLLHGTRNYQRIQDIEEHLPEFRTLLSDSPALMYDKLVKAERNILRMEAHGSQYMVKNAPANAPAPVLTPDRGRIYAQLARTQGGTPDVIRQRAREMAQQDGWLIP